MRINEGKTIMAANFITIKIAKLPGVFQEIALNGNRSLKTALETAELLGELRNGYNVQVNGESAQLTDELEQGDTVILSKKITGNR
jgi:hypothetical protein